MTVVDMGDLPESKVSFPELTELAHRWPPAVITHMRWRQPELEELKQAARVQYRKKQPAACEFCGTMIRCDMYRHVARCHLGVGSVVEVPGFVVHRLEGCAPGFDRPCSGIPQVPEEVQHIKLETLIPPWTVTRQVYMDSLTSRHSGISNDILLFSDIGLSLTHHYRVHRRGVPHVAFRRNYVSQFCALLPLPAVLLTGGRSPDPGSSSVEDSPDVMTDSSRPSRCTFARRCLTQIRETPRLTEQDTLAAAGSMVFDCAGAMDVSGTERSEIRSMTRAGVVTAAPPKREQSFGRGDLLSSI